MTWSCSSSIWIPSFVNNQTDASLKQHLWAYPWSCKPSRKRVCRICSCHLEGHKQLMLATAHKCCRFPAKRSYDYQVLRPYEDTAGSLKVHSTSEISFKQRRWPKNLSYPLPKVQGRNLAFSQAKLYPLKGRFLKCNPNKLFPWMLQNTKPAFQQIIRNTITI